MENENIDIEDVARMDLFLRSDDGLKNILNIESLIVVENDQDSVNKLKKAVAELMPIKDRMPDDIKDEWERIFVKQVRMSVDRAKKKKK